MVGDFNCVMAWQNTFLISCKGIHSMQKVQNVFDAILTFGHDEDFKPTETDEFEATAAPAGSDAKIAILRCRVEEGLPLWHQNDRVDYSGLTGAIRPRE